MTAFMICVQILKIYRIVIYLITDGSVVKVVARFSYLAALAHSSVKDRVFM